jgi:hypothetical protein
MYTQNPGSWGAFYRKKINNLHDFAEIACLLIDTMVYWFSDGGWREREGKAPTHN